jgi:hypothetical protein
MLSRWGRLMVALATALAVWAIAAPARAEAPLCDPRGATGIAPAPQLQQPVTSIDVGAPQDDCSELLSLTLAIDDGRTPEPPAQSTANEPLVTSAVPAVCEAAVSGAIERESVSWSERAGARDRVDRPPRC